MDDRHSTTGDEDYSNRYGPNEWEDFCHTTTALPTTVEPTFPVMETTEDVTEEPYQAMMKFLFDDVKSDSSEVDYSKYGSGNNYGYGGGYGGSYNYGNYGEKEDFKDIFCDCMDEVGPTPDYNDRKGTNEWNKKLSECIQNEYSKEYGSDNDNNSTVSKWYSKHHKRWSYNDHTSTQASEDNQDSLLLDSDLSIDSNNSSKNLDFAFVAILSWFFGVVLLFVVVRYLIRYLRKSVKQDSEYEDIGSQSSTVHIGNHN